MSDPKKPDKTPIGYQFDCIIDQIQPDINGHSYITLKTHTKINEDIFNDTGKKSLEETIFKVNEEATYEIAKQVRLRDIGGIIIVDYIDMNDKKNKEKIEKLLKEKLKEDRAKTQVEGFTKLDLMEFTRKHICNHIN